MNKNSKIKIVIATFAELVKIIIDCITIPLYFIKLFCDKAVLPGFDSVGHRGTYTRYYYYSIFDKIQREGMAFLVWGAVAIIILSIILSVLSMIFKEKKTLKIASHIVFGIAIVLFFVLFFMAASIRYCY